MPAGTIDKTSSRWHSERAGQQDIVSAGASIGAFDAVAVLCRYPEVFVRAIGLSGSYDVGRWQDADQDWTLADL